jgi:hypothetical protein
MYVKRYSNHSAQRLFLLGCNRICALLENGQLMPDEPGGLPGFAKNQMAVLAPSVTGAGLKP